MSEIKNVKVIYDGDEIDLLLDDAIAECLKKFGLKRWASGYDLRTNERDLSFSVR